QPSQTNDSTDIIDGILHKITAGKLTTTINGINSNQLSVFDTITLKMPLLYNDVTINGLSNKMLTPTLKSQPINFFLAGPATGGAAAPTFRGLADADLASLNVVSYATPSNPNYLPKFGITPNKLTNSKLYEDPTVGTTLGFIGWGTTNPKNNFVINSSTTSTLQLTSNAALATSGFVAKFNGTNTLLSTQGEMFLNDNSATPIERLRLTNTDVFVGKNLVGNYISLDLSDKLKIRGNAGVAGEVLTSQGIGSPPQWLPVVGSDIWQRNKFLSSSDTIISQKHANDNVWLGDYTNHSKAKLQIFNATNDALYVEGKARGATFENNQGDTATVSVKNNSIGPALQVDGGQIVKTRVLNNINGTQNKGDYIIILNNTDVSYHTLNLLKPSTVPEGTIIIIRNTGTNGMYIDIDNVSAGSGTFDLYSNGFFSGLSVNGTSNQITIPPNKKACFRLVASGNSWIEW
ncbi:MAG: hypothetical protein ABL940_13390, partial [Bacteroidia bacterium]